jgi:hypothetical protein
LRVYESGHEDLDAEEIVGGMDGAVERAGGDGGFIELEE